MRTFFAAGRERSVNAADDDEIQWNPVCCGVRICPAFMRMPVAPAEYLGLGTGLQLQGILGLAEWGVRMRTSRGLGLGSSLCGRGRRTWLRRGWMATEIIPYDGIGRFLHAGARTTETA